MSPSEKGFMFYNYHITSPSIAEIITAFLVQRAILLFFNVQNNFLIVSDLPDQVSVFRSVRVITDCVPCT